MFFKIVVLKISLTSQESTCVGVSCRVETLLQHYQKETPTQVFSCEVCEILRTPPVAASGNNKSQARLFTLGKQTFSSHSSVTFLKQPLIYGFIDDKNKESLITKFFRLS